MYYGRGFLPWFQVSPLCQRCVGEGPSPSSPHSLTSLPPSPLLTNSDTGIFFTSQKKTIILQQYLFLSKMIYVVRHYLFGVEYLIIILLLCSFGCEHDGENNTCPEDGHVMNSTSARNTSNIWQFSSCSESYIKTLLHKLDR